MPRTAERILQRLAMGLFRLTRPRGPSPGTPQASIARILVVRQHNQMGDMLCVVPLLRALRAAYPAAFIALVASPSNADVMLHNRFLDETICFDKREFLAPGRLRLGNLLGFIRKLRDRRFDLALVPSTVSMSFTSDFLAYLSGAPERIGARSIDGRENSWSGLFTTSVALDWRRTPQRHQALRNLDIAAPLGIFSDDCSTEITLRGDEEREGKAFVADALGGASLAIGVHPGAGKIPNRWPAENFARALESLAAGMNARIFLTSGPMDAGPVGDVVRRLSGNYTMIENRPVRSVAAILKHLDIVVTNDTGIMHVAGAVGVPVLALFGATDPLLWAPTGPQNRSLRGEKGVIASITVEEVVRNAREMLRERKVSRRMEHA